ncbi:MAG: prepilin-type N-terminal cleavage/methylation domain-containing protein [Candidatus Peregrinibacteria bacterium]
MVKLRSHPTGFSLIELTVVVAILAVMAGSVLVGFNSFGGTINARETVGRIGDIIRESEMAILQGDYQKISIHFFEDYLVLEEAPAEAELPLSLGNTCVLDLRNGHDLNGSGTLYKKDEEDRLLEIVTLALFPPLCANFEGAEESEWRYQLISGDQPSPVLRFFHFNLGTDYKLRLGEDAYRLEIEAPYNKKQLYKNNSFYTGSVALPLYHNGADTGASITLQH